MKKYTALILNEEDQKSIIGKRLTFSDGFVNGPKVDWWNTLQTYYNMPLVSVRPSGRESWNEIICIFAKGWIQNNKVVLDYSDESEIKDVLMDIFQEADNDEYEVFDYYMASCSSEVWEHVTDWVHTVW